MKFTSALDKALRTGIKIRREWWHEYEFVFCAENAGFKPEEGCMEFYITRVGDRYDDIYPINTTLLWYKQMLLHGRTGHGYGNWAPLCNDILATDWKVCKNWRMLNGKARERSENSFPHSKTTLSTLTFEDYKRTNSAVYYYDKNNT